MKNLLSHYILIRKISSRPIIVLISNIIIAGRASCISTAERKGNHSKMFMKTAFSTVFISSETAAYLSRPGESLFHP